MNVRSAAIWAILGQYSGFALQFVVSVILSRYFLSPAEFGLFSLAFSAAAMVSIMQDFGLNRYIVAADTLDEGQLRTCLTVSMIAGMAIAALICAIAWPAAIFYRDMRLIPILALIGGSFLLLPLNTVPIALLQRDMRFRETSLINLAATCGNAGVTLAMAANGFSTLALAFGVVAQQLSRGLMAQWLCPVRLNYRPQLAGALPLARFGSGTTALAISGAIGGRTPELVIGRAIGVAAVGLYGRAVSLADQLRMLLSGAITSVFYSVFSQLKRDKGALGPTYERMVACYTGITWPVMTMLAVVADPLVLALYGPSWAAVGPLLRWISLSELLFVALPMHTEMPLLAGRLRGLLWRNALDTATSLILLLVAVRFGLIVAAMSRLAYGILWYGIYAGFLREVIGFRPSKLAAIYARSGLATVLAVLPCAVVVIGAGAGSSLFLLAAAGIAGGVLWLAALFIGRHPLAEELIRLLPKGGRATPTRG